MNQETEIRYEVLNKQLRESTNKVSDFKMNFLPDLKEGDLIDAQDKVNIWRGGKIVQREEAMVEVEFLGWTSKWNEQKNLSKGKVMPYRTQVKGYSGSKKRKITDHPIIENLIFGLMEVEVSVFEKSEFFVEAEPTDITTKIRGDLFQTMNMVLMIFTRLEENHLSYIDKILNRSVTFILRFLDEVLSPTHMPIYVLGSAKNKFMSYLNKSIAIVDCSPEMFELFEAVLGVSDRTKKLYITNNLDNPAKFDVCYTPKDDNSKPNYLLNVFLNKNGFTKILELMTNEWIVKNKEETMKIHTATKLICFALNTIRFIFIRLKKSVISQFCEKLIEAMNTYLKNISHADVEFNALEDYLKCLRYYYTFHTNFLNGKSKNILDIEEVALNVHLRFLSSKVFKKKFQGIKSLVEQLEKTKDEFEKEKKRNILLHNKVLDIIYISGYHREIAQRSHKVLEFLSPNLDSKLLIGLLQSAFLQSEEKSSVICGTVRNVIKSLNLKVVQNILTFLKKVAPGKIRPETIELVLQIIIQSHDGNSLFNIYKNRREAQRVFDEALSFLWRCLENAEELSSSTVNTVLNALKNQVSNTEEKKKLIMLCLKNLKNNSCGTQHIILLHHIMNTLSSKSTLILNSSFDKFMDMIYVAVPDFTMRILEEFKNRTKSNVVEDHFIDDQIFNVRLQLIILLIFKGKPRPDSKNGFNQLMKFLTQSDTKKVQLPRFLKIIKNRPIISKDNSSIFFSIFEQKNAFLKAEDISLEIFDVFKKLFMKINVDNGGFKNFLSPRYFQIIKKEKILHLNSLWNVCLRRKIDPSIKDSFFELLTSCYFMAKRKFIAQDSLVAWNQFVSDVKEYKNKVKNSIELGNLAYSWTTALDLCLGVKSIKNERTKDLTLKVIVKNEEMGLNQQYTLPYNTSLNSVRIKLMKDLHLEETETVLTYNEKDLRYDHLELYSVGMAYDNKREFKEGNRLILGFRVKSEGIETPSTMLRGVRKKIANDPDLSYSFFENIDLEPTDHIWNLLISLPLNEKRTRKILRIQNISELITMVSIDTPKYTLYSFHIIYQILKGTTLNLSAQTRTQFKNKLIEEGGANLLINMVIAMDYESMKIKQRVLAVTNGVFKLLNFFFKDGDQGSIQVLLSNPEDFKNYFSKCSELLYSIIHNFEKEGKLFFSKNLSVAFKHYAELLIYQTESEGENQTLRDWGQIYLTAFQQQNNIHLKAALGKNLVVFSKKILEKPELIDQFILPLYTVCLPKFFENPENSQSLLKLIVTVANQTQFSSITEFNSKYLLLDEKWKQTLSLILESKPGNEEFMSSCYHLLKITVLTHQEGLDEWVSQNKESIKTLMEVSLLKSNGEQAEAPLCSTPETLKAIFNFMLTFLDSSEVATQLFFEYIQKLVMKGNWRTGKYQDWNIQALVEERKTSKYAGLKNLGCICYMNSCFQQLFMIPEFRDYIIASDVKKDKDGDFQSNPLFQFQYIMKSLRDVARNYHSPEQFCRKVKIFEQQSINVLTQMDASEFMSNLFDKLENELKKTDEQGNAIQRVFGGETVQEIICKDHDYKSERATPFIALPVEVKGNVNLKQCLDQFVTGEMLEGENQYFCDELDQKVDALKRECIKKLPNVLIIVLKRFSFDYETLERGVKINDLCEFPEALDMTKYTQESLNDKEGDKPSSYYNYNLRGVIIHKGSANSGHYYSLIKDKNQKWFEFNDTVVREFDYSDIAAEAYGDSSNNTHASIMGSDKRKGTNAYMLFYEKEAFYNENNDLIGTLLQGFGTKAEVLNGGNTGGSQMISQEILHENFDHYLKRILLDNTFADFICDSLEKLKFDSLDENKIMLRVGFTSFFHLLIRKATKDKIPRTYKILCKVIECSPQVAKWFLEQTCSTEFVQEFLIDSKVRHMRYFTAGLIKIAIKTLSPELNDETTKLLNDLANIYFYFGFKTDQNISMLQQVFEILAELSEIHVVSQYLSGLDLPKTVLVYLVIEGFKDNETEIAQFQILAANSNYPGSIFSGYLGKNPHQEIVSIEDIQWQDKEKIITQRDFDTNYSYIFLSFSNVLNQNPECHSFIKQELLNNMLWKKIIVNSKNRKAAYKFCDFFAKFINELNESNWENILQSIQSTCIHKTNIEVEGFLYLMKNIANAEEDISKRIPYVLNVFTELLHERNINNNFHTFLNYMLYMLKENKKMFNKIHLKGEGFLIQISDSLKQELDKRRSQLRYSQKAQSTVFKSRKSTTMSTLNKYKTNILQRLDLVREGKYEEYCQSFSFDYDFLFESGNLDEVDYWTLEDGWKTFEVGENLGVMLKLKDYFPVMNNHRDKWVEYDNTRLAYPHTAAIEHKFNPTIFY